MKVKYTGKSNGYLTNGKVYAAKLVANQHGDKQPLYGITNDKGEDVVVSQHNFEIV